GRGGARHAAEGGPDRTARDPAPSRSEARPAPRRPGSALASRSGAPSSVFPSGRPRSSPPQARGEDAIRAVPVRGRPEDGLVGRKPGREKGSRVLHPERGRALEERGHRTVRFLRFQRADTIYQNAAWARERAGPVEERGLE